MKITEIMKILINKIETNRRDDLYQNKYVQIQINEQDDSRISFPNPWNYEYISSFRSYQNLNNVVFNPTYIGICIDNDAELLLSASMCGIFALNFKYKISLFENEDNKVDQKYITCRISLIGHDLHGLLNLLDTLTLPTSYLNQLFALAELDSIELFEKLPDRVYIARGSFWEQTHIEVRNAFVSACRLIKQSHINIDPVDGIVSDKSDSLPKYPVYNQIVRRSSIGCESVYKCDDNCVDEYHEKIVLLPSMRFPALTIARWLSDKECLYPLVFEYVASAIERDRFILSVPCGFTVDKLPISLQISASKKRILDAIVLAQWYRSLTKWPTTPS
jgi:hypothetical protein